MCDGVFEFENSFRIPEFIENSFVVLFFTILIQEWYESSLCEGIY